MSTTETAKEDQEKCPNCNHDLNMHDGGQSGHSCMQIITPARGLQAAVRCMCDYDPDQGKVSS